MPSQPRWKLTVKDSGAGHAFKTVRLERFYTKDENQKLGLALVGGYRFLGILDGMTMSDIQALSDDLDKSMLELPDSGDPS